MAEVVLCHHVQGLTLGIGALADSLRSEGHVVHTPDLFAGATFASVEAGMAHFQTLGMPVVLERALTAVAGLAPGLVYAGVSMGAMYAELLTLLRPGARGAVLLESAVPVDAFSDLRPDLSWPGGVPFQIHGMDGDPYFAGEGDIDAAREMVATLPNGELFIYPGNVHLFCDASLASYDGAATALALARIGDFLAGVDAG